MGQMQQVEEPGGEVGTLVPTTSQKWGCCL